jgi:hypothetical protein
MKSFVPSVFPLTTPVLISCGYNLCLECLRQHLTITNHYPLNRQMIRIRLARRSESIFKSRDCLTVKCSNAGQGCYSGVSGISLLFICCYVNMLKSNEKRVFGIGYLILSYYLDT